MLETVTTSGAVFGLCGLIGGFIFTRRVGIAVFAGTMCAIIGSGIAFSIF